MIHPIPISLMVQADITGSAVIRTSALIVQDKNFKALIAELEPDLGHQDNCISHPEA